MKIDRGREAIDVDCLVPYPEGTAMKNKKTSDKKRFFLGARGSGHGGVRWCLEDLDVERELCAGEYESVDSMTISHWYRTG